MQVTSSIEPVVAVDHVVEAPGRHRRNRHDPGPGLRPLALAVAQVARDGRTPWWTRHTRGAIEAGRDRRLQGRAPGPIRYWTAPRAAAVVIRADFAREGWADDGGGFDRAASMARTRVGAGGVDRPRRVRTQQRCLSAP